MTLLFSGLLCSAVLLLLKPPLDAASRLRAASGRHPGPPVVRKGRRLAVARTAGGRRARKQGPALTLMVQQLAALLKGGRTAGRLWDELWTVYGAGGQDRQPTNGQIRSGALSLGSTTVLASARAAAATGAPVGESIRRAVSTVFADRDGEGRTWFQLAACFDIAEASGCPLADVLTRFAAQLEAEEDSDAARQTALAGPKATVRLLTWLPLMGLGLGAALGVDPLATLLGTPLGLAALMGGVVLTLAGRAWSARLVSAAAGVRTP
ncbi:type II secretion system F family protein [Pseudarthrobacter phenanthrenivorans]|uniref:type II secretion system F family protein n=1 Tax=Pseudarthrobacter phenanthrenivorans TaxID=361575 RepID=UPI002F35BB00